MSRNRISKNELNDDLKNDIYAKASSDEYGKVKIDNKSLKINPLTEQLYSELSDYVDYSVKNLYVDSSLGTDSKNNGISQGTGAYKTINYALGTLAKTNLNKITIVLASGTYNETVNISNFNIGEIHLIGDNSTNTIVNSITIRNSDKVSVEKLSTINGFDVRSSKEVMINECKKISSNSSGIYFLNVKGSISNSEISNSTSTALFCDGNSIIYLYGVIGNNNLVGINCKGSVVRKNSTTNINGTTNQQVSDGGQIL